MPVDLGYATFGKLSGQSGSGQAAGSSTVTSPEDGMSLVVHVTLIEFVSYHKSSS